MAPATEAVLHDLSAPIHAGPPRAKHWRPLLSAALLRTQTDQRLTALAAGGHQPAFAAIFERYERELRAHARRIVRPDQVDDVVQQTMLSAWLTVGAGTQISDLRAWLHRVTHNSALNLIARRGHADVELPQALRDPVRTDDLVETRLTAAQALAAMADLPEGQRRALTLTAIEGRSGHDAAAAMGVSEGALRQIVHRARVGLRAGVSAVTPLPLLSWAAGPASSPAASSLSELGAGAGLTATAIKLTAVVAVTGAALGGASHLPRHHQRPAPASAGRSGLVRTTQTHDPHLSATSPLAAALSFPAAQSQATQTAGAWAGAGAHAQHGNSGKAGEQGSSGGQDRGRQGDPSGGQDRGGQREATSGQGAGKSGSVTQDQPEQASTRRDTSGDTPLRPDATRSETQRLADESKSAYPLQP